MDIDNRSPYTVATVPQQLPDGRYALVVVVKATYRIEPLRVVLADEQLPILFADEVQEESQGVWTRFESDIALIKLRTDVAVVGTARAPHAQPVKQMDVAVKVGNWSKVLTVYGARHWVTQAVNNELIATPPNPFIELPLDYTHAYGGTTYASNPVGKGYLEQDTKLQKIVGVSLPEITYPRVSTKFWNAPQAPASLGFIAKSWQPRVAHLGTYDAEWESKRAPSLPEDFQFDFYNATARDQQIEGYLHGNETVSLWNIGLQPEMHFTLPGERPHIAVISPKATVSALNPRLDTLCIMADQSQFYLVWRGVHQIEDASAQNVAMLRIGKVQN